MYKWLFRAGALEPVVTEPGYKNPIVDGYPRSK